MKAIFFLGNPGEEYKNTKHNVGIMFLDFFLNNKNICLDKKNFLGEWTKISSSDLFLCKPNTYMNLSGDFVYFFVNYFKINIDDILVVYDDFNIDFPKFKLSSNGSAGGHNGMKDIINKLKTSEIKRLRIGIGKEKIDQRKFVLSKFSKNQIKELEDKFALNCDLINDFNSIQFEKLMTKYNGK